MTAVKTAIDAPELPRDAWFSAALHPDVVHDIYASLNFAENPLEIFRHGLDLTNTRIHTSAKPLETDFSARGYAAIRQSLELRGDSELETAQYIGSSVLTLGMDGKIEVESITTIGSANEFSLNTTIPGKRFHVQTISFDATLTEGSLTPADKLSRANIVPGIRMLEGCISPLDASSPYTGLHLLVGQVSVDSTLLDLL